MKPWMLAAAVSLAALATGCNRNTPTPTPTPKAGSANTSPSGTGATAPVRSSANAGRGNEEDNRSGAQPHQEQVDPNHAEQRRDFQQSGDAAGPKSPDTAPMVRNK